MTSVVARGGKPSSEEGWCRSRVGRTPFSLGPVTFADFTDHSLRKYPVFLFLPSFFSLFFFFFCSTTMRQLRKTINAKVFEKKRGSSRCRCFVYRRGKRGLGVITVTRIRAIQGRVKFWIGSSWTINGRVQVDPEINGDEERFVFVTWKIRCRPLSEFHRMRVAGRRKSCEVYWNLPSDKLRPPWRGREKYLGRN